MHPNSSNMYSNSNMYNQNNNNMYNPNKRKQLMSFQYYLRTLNNNVEETAAVKKYQEFMANLIHTKVERFFDANKDREWFRFKYHPVDSQKRVQEQAENLQKRLKIFEELNSKNYFDKLAYSTNNAPAVLNLMDAVAISLDDGPQELIDQLLGFAQTSCDDEQGDAMMIDSDLKHRYIPLKPNSIVIYDVDIEATLSEIQELCLLASPNLVRMAQLEPYYVDGGQLRRKFVAVYRHPEEIRDICWKLSRMKLNNRMLSVSINKCLNKRVHSVDALSNHFICIVNDIRSAILLVLYFDELRGLFSKKSQTTENMVVEETTDAASPIKIKQEPQLDSADADAIDNVAPLSPPGSDKSVKDEDEEKPFDVNTLDEDKEKEKKKVFELKFSANPSLHRQVSKLNKSKNPLLKGACLYLTEFIESSTFKSYLSRVPKDLRADPNEDGDIELDERDKYSLIEVIVKYLPCDLEESTRFLDRLLWYLRIVHSFDFYKRRIYSHENELSLRMSVIHLRDDLTESIEDVSADAIKKYLLKAQQEMQSFEESQAQKYVTKDEERFNYRSYGKVIIDELTSYVQRQQKPKSTDTEEVYKCKHCTRVFQKLADIGRHFVGKHRWAIDAIELETDFFNAYLFDPNKIDPSPPKELIDKPPNRFANMTSFSQMGEDPDLLQQTMETYSKMESFVREPAPRAQVESDPRNDTIVDYTDISFDDAI